MDRLMPMLDAVIDASADLYMAPKSLAERLRYAENRAHPLTMLQNTKQIRMLIKEATPEERDKIIKAYDHYLKTFSPGYLEEANVREIQYMLEHPETVNVDNPNPLVMPRRIADKLSKFDRLTLGTYKP